MWSDAARAAAATARRGGSKAAKMAGPAARVAGGAIRGAIGGGLVHGKVGAIAGAIGGGGKALHNIRSGKKRSRLEGLGSGVGAGIVTRAVSGSVKSIGSRKNVTPTSKTQKMSSRQIAKAHAKMDNANKTKVMSKRTLVMGHNLIGAKTLRMGRRK